MDVITHGLARLKGRVWRRSLGLAAPFVRSEIPVLTYHSIDDSGSLLSVSAQTLRSQLAVLRSEGWRSLSIHEYGVLAAAGRVEPRTFLITFDDGYRNFLQQAAPALSDFGFIATVFVPVSFIGQRPLWLKRDVPRMQQLLNEVGMTRAERDRLIASTNALLDDDLMDWQELRSLGAAGFDVQSHSAGHHFLTGLSPDELAADLRHSREALEANLCCPAPAIAYPYGASNVAVAEAARAAGFTIGFIADHGPREIRGLMEWRAGVSDQMSPHELLAMLRCWPLYPRLRAWWRRGRERS